MCKLYTNVKAIFIHSTTTIAHIRTLNIFYTIGATSVLELKDLGMRMYSHFNLGLDFVSNTLY